MHLQSVRIYQEKSQSSKVKNNFKNHSVPGFGMSENAGQTTDVFEKNNNKTAPDNAEKPAVKNTAAVKNEIKNEIKQGAQALKEEAPVVFEYYPDKPNIKKSIGIRLGAYKNICKLSEEFFEKYVRPSIKDLEYWFAFMVEQEKEKITAEFPNCILIEDPTDTIADDLIKMTKDMSDVNYAAVEGKEGLAMLKELDEVMEKAKANFKETGRRTLLKVDNFDKICMQGLPFEIGEYMKSVMTSCADDYGTTIIFKTKNRNIMIDETLASHRCGIKCILHATNDEEMIKKAQEEISKEAPVLTKLIEKEQEEINRPKNTPKTEAVKPDNAEKPAAKNTAAVKNEIKNEIKQGAQKLEDTAKKELKEIKNELAANLPKQRGGGKFKKIFFLIIAPLGAIAAAAAKFKDRILVFLKGIRNENSSSNETEHK